MSEEPAVLTKGSPALPPTLPTRAKNRTALFGGLGALLVLLAIVSVDGVRTLNAFASNSAQIRQDFLNREKTLDQVRAGLYESAEVVRAETQPDSDQAMQQALRTQLDSIRGDTNAALSACIRSLPPDAKAPFQKFAQQLDLYWETLDPIFTLNAEKRDSELNSLLRNEVLQQQSHALAIATSVDKLTASDLQDEEQQEAAALQQSRRRFLWTAAIIFSLGVFLAATAIIFAGAALER